MKITINYEDMGTGATRWVAGTTVADKYLCACAATKEDARAELINKVRAWQSAKTESEEIEI